MKQAIHLIARAYAWLVKLYPPSHRTQFEQEMVTLFCELMSDATQKGLPALFVVCFREFWDLPGNLIDAQMSDLFGGRRPMLGVELNDESLRTARWGAVGFGLGFAFIFLARYVLQAFGFNNIGDFFTVWILGLGTILYGIAGGLGGALIGLASISQEEARGMRAWRLAVPSAVAGFFALALGWFATTIYAPFLISSSASISVRAAVEGMFVNFLKPLVMGALLVAFLSTVRDGRTFLFRRVIGGAVSFELGHIAGLVAIPFLQIAASLLGSWFGVLAPRPSDELIRAVGVLVSIIEGTVSGALLGLVLSQRRTETPPQLAG